MLYIRTDANQTIATGHVMRCMSIANEVVKLGHQVTFLVADEQATELIEEGGYPWISLDTKWDFLELEIEKMISLIRKYKIDKLLIDSYYVTKHYLSELKKYTKIFYLDDLAAFDYPVDVLINYNIYAEKLEYQRKKNANVDFYLGCKYVPLREEFCNIDNTFSEDVSRILISTGGADSFHIARKFIQYLEQEELLKEQATNQKNSFKSLVNQSFNLEALQYHIIVGKYNLDKEYLLEAAEKYPQIVLHFDVKYMSEIMVDCHVAITAGGSSMYELCACGLPMITYTFADNQLLGVKEFQQLEIASYCGDIRKGETDLWKNIKGSIVKYAINQELRRDKVKKMKSLVDGQGAKRVAEILVLMS